MRMLFVAWQDPQTRSWHPVARLTYDDQVYRFVYTRGATNERFRPFEAFPQTNLVYESPKLPPFFANRVPPRSRPDFSEFVECLNIPQSFDDPIALLARSGGRRATDSLEMFPCPELHADGTYHIHFFAHGLRHFPHATAERIEKLKGGEELLLVWDFQNRHDRHALLLRTEGENGHDPCLVGFCPRYLVPDIFNVLMKGEVPVRVSVERVNPPPAPLQLRLLCSMTAKWPSGFAPCTGDEYQPLVNGDPDTCVDAKTGS